MLGNDIVKEQLVVGARCYNMYETKTPEQVTVIRKLEKMLEKITTLDNEAYLNVRLFDLTEKRKLLVEKKVPFGALLLENMQLEACIELDPNFCELFGELISKISPGFDQSPLMGFMDLFSEAGINLEYFSFDTDSKILRV